MPKSGIKREPFRWVDVARLGSGSEVMANLNRFLGMGVV